MNHTNHLHITFDGHASLVAVEKLGGVKSKKTTYLEIPRVFYCLRARLLSDHPSIITEYPEIRQSLWQQLLRR